METNVNHYFLFGNMAWTGTLIAVIAYFIRKWINNTETTIKDNRNMAKEENEKTAATLAIRNKESHEEIASKIKENRDIYIKTYDELKKGIGEVYDLQRVANGSVGELKGKVGEIVTRCEERSRVFYQEGEKFKRRKK